MSDTMHIIELPRAGSTSLSAICRQMVEDGATDGPARVMIDGKHCLNIRSIHTYALLTYSEDPSLRIVPWVPHPNTTPGPRVRALLDARDADKRLTKEYGRPLR